MNEYPAWLLAALERIEQDAPIDEVVTDKTKAAELGVPIGTTVRHFQPRPYRADPQAALDDLQAMNLIRAGIVEMPLPRTQ